VEVAAYRIVQEAVTNVIRHARARQCSITVQVNGAIDLVIVDDGMGLPAQVRNGVGFTSMRERADELGGQFTVEGLAGGGTCLRVRFPLS